MFHVLHYNKGEGKREGAKEGESRAQGMGKFILRLECVYTPLALPFSHFNNFGLR